MPLILIHAHYVLLVRKCDNALQVHITKSPIINFTAFIAYILDFQGEPIVTKFEFLKALAIARVYGFKEYEKALTFKEYP